MTSSILENKSSLSSGSSISIEDIAMLRKMKKHFADHDSCRQDLERELNNSD